MREQWRSLAPIPLRLILGSGFMYHGFPKLFSAGGHQNFVGMLQGSGMPAPELTAWAVGGFEFFGGLALVVGAFTAAISVLGAVEMAVAALLVHLPAGFNFLNITGQTETGAPIFGIPGYEVNLLYIAGFLALALGGAGALSVDSARRGEQKVTGRLPVEPMAPDIPDRAWSGEPGTQTAGTGSER